MNDMPIVISLFDFTGEALKPWAGRGYNCYALDIQHEATPRHDAGITYCHADLSDLESTIKALGEIGLRRSQIDVGRVAMVLGWPPCTDLAGSGACRWKSKREKNPAFQAEAVAMARVVEEVGGYYNAPWALENPVGALSTLWRKPDHIFHPYEFGGWIAEAEAEHPIWPEYIPAQDAYMKKTCFWVGGGFVMPEKRPVEPEILRDQNGNKCSRPWLKLGGKSLRTKNIRSATPRGIARAIAVTNIQHSCMYSHEEI